MKRNNMRRILLGLSLTILMLSCSSVTDIKGTEWIGVEKDKNTSIVFNDSTCEIYKRFETGHVDTIKALYMVNKDTISFAPFDEFVTIGSNLIIAKKELKESKSGNVVFKYKER